MSRLSQIPPLPADWPFPLRGAGSEFTLRPLSELPGFLGAWSLLVPSDLGLGVESTDVEGVFGRGGLRRMGDIIVRPYRRGGLVRHFDESLYLNPERFTRELTVHRALWATGFPTVEPLGCGYRRRLWGVEGVYLTRFMDALPWPNCWERSDQVIPQLKILLKALCAWGLHAPDLNATNVLVTSENQVLLLDWDRASWVKDGNLMARYQSRLRRSLKKLGAPAGILELI
jgi:hypothetical protein